MTKEEKKTLVPIWERPLITLDEASALHRDRHS